MRIARLALAVIALLCATVAAMPAHAAGLSYYAVAPCRLFDSRINAFPPAVFPSPLQAGVTYGYNYLNLDCVPTPNGDPHAQAIAVNVTAVNATAGGYLVLWADGLPMPGTSNINFSAGQVIANGMVVGVGANDNFDIHYSHSPGATVDILIDIVGYFAP